MLQAVDADVAQCADTVFDGEPFAELVAVLRETLRAGGRVCLNS